MEFAEEFKSIRKQLDMSQAELANLLDIPKRTVEAWEVSKRTPPAYVQRLLLKELENIKQENPLR